MAAPKLVSGSVEILRAKTPTDVEAVKTLFVEYADFLNVDLCFQGFDEEIASFPAVYEFLLLGKVNGKAAGATALKSLGQGECEMKRLYVRPEFQGVGLGRRLSIALMDGAREVGYRTMRLDTLKRLQPAIALYQSLGFAETDKYYDNPLDEVVYMERHLT